MTETQSPNSSAKDNGGGSGSNTISSPWPRSSNTGNSNQTDQVINPSSTAENVRPTPDLSTTGTDRNGTTARSALGYEQPGHSPNTGTNGQQMSEAARQYAANQSSRSVTGSPPPDIYVTTRDPQGQQGIHPSDNTVSNTTNITFDTQHSSTSQAAANATVVNDLRIIIDIFSKAIGRLEDKYNSTFPNEQDELAAAEAADQAKNDLIQAEAFVNKYDGKHCRLVQHLMTKLIGLQHEYEVVSGTNKPPPEVRRDSLAPNSRQPSPADGPPPRTEAPITQQQRQQQGTTFQSVGSPEGHHPREVPDTPVTNVAPPNLGIPSPGGQDTSSNGIPTAHCHRPHNRYSNVTDVPLDPADKHTWEIKIGILVTFQQHSTGGRRQGTVLQIRLFTPTADPSEWSIIILVNDSKQEEVTLPLRELYKPGPFDDEHFWSTPKATPLLETAHKHREEAQYFSYDWKVYQTMKVQEVDLPTATS